MAWRIKSGNALSYYSDGLKIVGKYLCTCIRAYECPSVPTLKVFYFICQHLILFDINLINSIINTIIYITLNIITNITIIITL